MSKLLESINSIFQKNIENSEEENLFFAKDLWEGNSKKEMEFNLAFQDYYSPLKPCFLGHYKNPQVLNRFKLLMARDGILGLKSFFKDQNEPLKDLTLLIPFELSFLVPLNWMEQCAYYKINSTLCCKNSFKNLIIDGQAEPENINIDIFSEKLSNLKDYDNVYLMLDSSHKDRKLYNDVCNILIHKYENKLTILQASDLFEKNLKSTHYLNAHTLPFTLFDSYTKYNLLEAGASPLNTMDIDKVHLSLPHGLFQEIQIFDLNSKELNEKNYSFQKGFTKYKDQPELLLEFYTNFYSAHD